MSALNPRQLQMFMPVSQIVGEVNKGDARHKMKQGLAPEDQWSAGTPSLRELKQNANTERADMGYRHRLADAPPIPLVHSVKETYWDSPVSGPTMIDGHHRLAKAESSGMTELAVEHFETPEDYYRKGR